jgi:hypothetical protein
MCNNLKQNQSTKTVGLERISHFVTNYLTVYEYTNCIFRPHYAHKNLHNIQNTHPKCHIQTLASELHATMVKCILKY